MNKLNLKNIVVKILIISIIFTSIIPACSYALDVTGLSQEDMNKVMADIQDWLDSSKGTVEITEYKLKKEGTEDEYDSFWTVKMPEPDDGKNIYYSADKGCYIYILTDSNGNNRNLYFNVESLISTGNISSGVLGNSASYTQGQGSSIFMLDNNYYRTLSADFNYNSQKVSYVVEFTSDTGTKGYSCILNLGTKKIDGGKKDNVLDWLGNIVSAVVNWVVNTILLPFINWILLGIADGISALIDAIFGSTQKLTIYNVIFGKVDKLSIDFWEEGLRQVSSTGIVGGAPKQILKPIVEHWYNVLRGIVIAVYLVMLLYIGIRILLATTGSSAKKYKDMLTSWLMGIVILTFYPYVMRYTVEINSAIVGMIEEESIALSQRNGTSSGQSIDAMEQVRKMARRTT